MPIEMRVYVQKLTQLTRKSDIEAITSVFAHRSQSVIDSLKLHGLKCDLWQVVEFRPNFAMPMKYSEVDDPTAFGLWNSFTVKYSPDTVQRGELNSIEVALKNDLACAVYIHSPGT